MTIAQLKERIDRRFTVVERRLSARIDSRFEAVSEKLDSILAGIKLQPRHDDKVLDEHDRRLNDLERPPAQ